MFKCSKDKIPKLITINSLLYVPDWSDVKVFVYENVENLTIFKI